MSDLFGLSEFAACTHESLRCENCGARSNIFGWQAYTDYDEIRQQLADAKEVIDRLTEESLQSSIRNGALMADNADLTARLAAAEAENKRLRMQNMDLLEIALEQALVYRDDNGQLRFTDSGDLVGKEG